MNNIIKCYYTAYKIFISKRKRENNMATAWQ